MAIFDIDMQWTALSEETKTGLEKLNLQQMAKLSFNGKVICVTRLEEGWYGIHNTCPHAGAQLHHGHCNKKGVIGCPLHGYKFDVRTGSSADGNNYKLQTYQFKTDGDKMYIGVK